VLLGLVGKTNVGKSTFFAAATSLNVEIANRPFTTIKPNRGIAYIRSKCVHQEFGVLDSKCIEGTRFIPVELMDVAGLVPGAHRGRGLGNKFLDDLRQADVFIHLVDASGGTDFEGRQVDPGSHDPLEDVKFLENELDEWFTGIIYKDWDKLGKLADQKALDNASILHDRLSGLGFGKRVIEEAMSGLELDTKKISSWSKDQVASFAKDLRIRGKPSVIGANKADISTAERNISRMRETLDVPVIPVVAEAELALRRAAQKGLIKYIPGENHFTVMSDSLSAVQNEALNRLSNLMTKFNGTGVQTTLETAVYQAYKGIVVYPVEDVNKLTDKRGNVLPDAFILKSGSKPIDLARKVHTELEKGYLYSIDAKTKQRLSSDYTLKNLDVVKIVSTQTN
jgi:ribosome-binding ATPase YchF (GTP1/OBG family)